MEELGQKIRSLRLGKGLSIKKLSTLLKINYTYISHIERGKSIPSEHLLKKIAKKLGADEEELEILSGKIPEDIKKILYEYPIEAPVLIRDALGSYVALKQLSFLKDKEKRLEQFFTPLDIASGMLELIGGNKTNQNARIIDPSCGDGVFLKAAKEKVLGFEIFGCDIDSEHINSVKSQIPEGIFIAGNALEALLQQEGSFDFAVGNPPFSAQDNLVTDKYILNNYRLGLGKKRQAVEILFLELFVRLLKRGGKFSIILPEGILSARPHKYVRDWLASNTVIYCIISLPRNTFKKTSSKCVIISGEKLVPEGSNRGNAGSSNFVKYAVFHRGNFSEVVNMVKNKNKNSIKQAELINTEDWRPENLVFIKMRQLCKKLDWACLGELVKLRTGFVKYGKDRIFDSKPKKRSCQLIVAKNFLPVTGLDLDKARNFIDADNSSFSIKAKINNGEILFVRVGVGCCGRVAVFDGDNDAQADDWIHILTPQQGVDPWYITSWMASSYGQRLIKLISHGVGTVSISKSSLGQLLIPRLDKNTEEDIAGIFKAFTKQQIQYGLWVDVLDEIFGKHIKNLAVLVPLPTVKRQHPLQHHQYQSQPSI